MAVEESNIIDFIAYNPECDRVMLVMVETREWGEKGHAASRIAGKTQHVLGLRA